MGEKKLEAMSKAWLESSVPLATVIHRPPLLHFDEPSQVSPCECREVLRRDHPSEGWKARLAFSRPTHVVVGGVCDENFAHQSFGDSIASRVSVKDIRQKYKRNVSFESTNLTDGTTVEYKGAEGMEAITMGH